MLVYLDSSAVLRLLYDPSESASLLRYIGREATVVSCRIAEADLWWRVSRSAGLAGAATAIRAALSIREVDSTLIRSAATLKSQDVDLEGALHLAAALELRAELDGYVTYDTAQAAAARALRLPVVSPA
jgi:PIN domain nuclease of toxin-antitoxin system